MHGMGIVLWAQSVMQVTLLMQIITYCLYEKYDSKSGFCGCEVGVAMEKG